MKRKSSYGEVNEGGHKVILITLYQADKLTDKLGKRIPYRTLSRHWECDVRKSISKGECINRRRMGKFGPKSIELDVLSKLSGISVSTLKNELEKEMVDSL